MERGFRFRLQKVLDYSEQVEKQRAEEMMETLQQKRREEKTLELLIGEKDAVFCEMADRTSRGTTAADLDRYNQYIISLKQFAEKHRTSLENIEKQAQDCRVKLLEASKNKKIMGSLKERHYGKFIYTAAKRSEKEIEDIINYKSAGI